MKLIVRLLALLSVAASSLLYTIGLLLVKPPVWVDGLLTLGIWTRLWKTDWSNMHRGR